jgi:hypothetical protein
MLYIAKDRRGPNMTTRKQTAIVGLKVRLREPLRKKLEVAAKQRGVSLNAELVSRLEQSFQAGDLTEAVRREFQNYLRLVVRGQKWPTRREQAVERLVGEHQALPGEKGEQRWRKAR